MKLKSLSPMLYTRKIQDTIDFYRDILGFSCTSYEPSWGWAALKKNQIRIMLSLPNDHLAFDTPGFTGSFYFETTDIDEFFRSVKEKVRLCYPLDDFDYGMREFAFWDNNGYLLQFGEAINT